MDPNDLEKYKKEIAQKQIKEQGNYFFSFYRINLFIDKIKEENCKNHIL
jgi:hypothetical protein